MKRHRFRWRQIQEGRWGLMSGGIGGGHVVAVVERVTPDVWRWRINRIDAQWQAEATQFIAQRKARNAADGWWQS
jgi:hypothetical protein